MATARPQLIALISVISCQPPVGAASIPPAVKGGLRIKMGLPVVCYGHRRAAQVVCSSRETCWGADIYASCVDGREITSLSKSIQTGKDIAVITPQSLLLPHYQYTALNNFWASGSTMSLPPQP